ncbi:MAG: terminase [Lachnospiraceae bacterium]|nr:terminase [Lachnospiraceae bacterium]
MKKTKKSTCDLSRHITPFIRLVETGEIRTSKEIKAMIAHVKRCFENEGIFVDDVLADKYLGMAKYFPYDQIFPWQQFVITLHDCCFYKDTNLPRWPDLFCMISRGAGKDGTIALESVALASPYNGIAGYDVDICANNEEQALRPVLDIVAAFDGTSAADQKKLKKYYKWLTESVKCISTGAMIRGRTNNPKGKDGMRSGMVVFNEIHQYDNYNNINVFTTGLGKHPHPRRSYFTTNGDVREGPLDDLIDTSEGILFGGDPDNGLLPFICRLDSKEEVHDPANWEKANPSLPYLQHLQQETEREYRDWVKNPARLPAFMTKRMNLPENTAEIQVTDYENIKVTNRELPDLSGWTCVAGIDYSKLTDWASVCLHFKQGDRRFDISHSWICTASKDIPRLKCPWQEWAANGRITIVDDVEIHPEIITGYIDAMKMSYSIRAVAVDDFRYALLARHLTSLGFDKEHKNLKLVRPSDIMRVAPVVDSCFVNQFFTWGDAPELRWATNNTKLIRYGRKIGQQSDQDLGNYVYGKIEAKSRKTDPFMALVAAMTIEDQIIERRTKPRKKLPVATY